MWNDWKGNICVAEPMLKPVSLSCSLKGCTGACSCSTQLEQLQSLTLHYIQAGPIPSNCSGACLLTIQAGPISLRPSACLLDKEYSSVLVTNLMCLTMVSRQPRTFSHKAILNILHILISNRYLFLYE